MTTSMARVAAIVGLICLPLSAQAPPATAIVGGTLVDGNGGAPIADAVVLLSGSRIVSAGRRRSVSILPARPGSTRAAAGSCPA